MRSRRSFGYALDHRDIELLKLRNFHVHKRVPDTLFTADDAQDQIVALLQALAPLVTHINRIVRPDPGDDEDDEGEDDVDDEGEGEGDGDEDEDEDTE